MENQLDLENKTVKAEFQANLACARIDGAIKEYLGICYGMGGVTHLTVGTQQAINDLFGALVKLDKSTERALDRFGTKKSEAN